MTSPAPYDPAYAQQVAEAQGYIPAALDGLTHHLNTTTGHTIARCGASSWHGTQLSLDWRLVDCEACRSMAP